MSMSSSSPSTSPSSYPSSYPSKAAGSNLAVFPPERFRHGSRPRRDGASPEARRPTEWAHPSSEEGDGDRPAAPEAFATLYTSIHATALDALPIGNAPPAKFKMVADLAHDVEVVSYDFAAAIADLRDRLDSIHKAAVDRDGPTLPDIAALATWGLDDLKVHQAAMSDHQRESAYFAAAGKLIRIAALAEKEDLQA